MRKLRILCLHGYHGSATVLSDQMRMPADGLEPLADFVCIDAPALAKGDFGWWHAKNSTRANVPGIARYEGWARTCERIVSAFKIEGPFDGIFWLQPRRSTGRLAGRIALARRHDHRAPAAQL
jgi:Serine hydrolase (FSH1)